MDLIQTYNNFEKSLDGFLNLTPLLDEIRAIADDYRPAAMMIAFVLLVFGAMRGFLHCDIQRFFQNLLRMMILVCLIGNTNGLITLFQNAANGLAAWPVTRQLSLGAFKVNFTTGQRPVIEKLLEVLQEKTQSSFTVQNKGSGNSSPPGDNGGSSPFGGINVIGLAVNAGQTVKAAAEQAADWVWDAAKNVVWQVLFGVYLLSLLLCKAVIVLMAFLQGVLVVLFGLYAPIGFAELSIPSFKHKGQGFFLTFVGLLCWPIGWSFVNAVTLELFQALPAPQNQSYPTLIVAIVASVPILLWVFVGHVLCPTFAQKIVIRGGAAIQAMAGAMVGVMTLGTANVYSGLLRGGSKLGDYGLNPKGRAAPPAGSAGVSSFGNNVSSSAAGDRDASQDRAGEFELRSLSDGAGKLGNQATESSFANYLPGFAGGEGGASRGGTGRFERKSLWNGARQLGKTAIERAPEIGARMIDYAGEVGKMVGDEMAEAAGDPVSREYQLVKPFRSSRFYGSSRSRFKKDSSQRARHYLD
ncbi:MAG: hypothetical protein WB586_14300 [Chthoniobacterales bacterium]